MDDDEFNGVRRVLEDWARWMRQDPDRHALGYPSRANPFLSGGMSVEGAFEEECAKADNVASEIANTLIWDLPIRQRGAVMREWLSLTIIVRDQEAALLEAYKILLRGMLARGLHV